MGKVGDGGHILKSLRFSLQQSELKLSNVRNVTGLHRTCNLPVCFFVPLVSVMLGNS